MKKSRSKKKRTVIGRRKVASLSIRSPGRMTDAERYDIASWLAKQAQRILNEADTLSSGVYTAGFSYVT